MDLETPKQALAAREAYEDNATKMTHAAKLESFRAASSRDQHNDVRGSLQNVIERVKSSD